MGMGPAAFGTNPLVITAGTTVTWTNADSMAHTTTSDTGVWDSGILAPNGTFSFTFANAGTFPYHCTIHGAASMSGSITVQAASSSSSGGGGGGGGGY
jgi:plastocyanin